jgi:branched-chain amino acid transport system ATP-binding protein
MVCTEIWNCIEQLKETGQAIFIIDRNPEALMHIADRHYIMEKGRFVWSGNTAAFVARPEFRQRYLGV